MRVHRSEAREDWWIGLDVSASMGVGARGKLQSAAEAAAATVAVGLRFGASVTVAWSDATGRPQHVVARRLADLARVIDALEALVVAPGAAGGLEALLDGGARARGRRAGRLLLFGDLLDVDVRAILSLVGGRRRIHLGQVLAAEEWDPASAAGGSDAVSWVDPETGARTRAADEPGTLAAYASRLEAFVEHWADLARAHRMVHHAWRADDPFEAHLGELLQ